MKSDEDYFSRNMTYFNVFLRILRLGEKYAYFTVFYNGFERTEQLWIRLSWGVIRGVRIMKLVLFRNLVLLIAINM